MKYAIISPCRNEAQYMQKTLDSVINQTVRPHSWIIVDDGSTDETPKILSRYAKKHEWIKIITRSDRGRRNVGPGVIEAFNEGLKHIKLDDFDYICKLDLDLKLPEKYFEILIDRMERNTRIGTCSGKPYEWRKGKFITDNYGDEMSVGASKFYRTSCFQEIGGFVKEVMWDAIDCHKCRYLGWIACSWDEHELRFEHLRPEGASQKNILTGRMRHGFGQYYMGTSLTFMIASAVYRMKFPPYITGGMFMLVGYLQSLLQRKPRHPDPKLRKFIRKYQHKALLKGKSKAIEEINAERRHVWEDRHKLKQLQFPET